MRSMLIILTAFTFLMLYPDEIQAAESYTVLNKKYSSVVRKTDKVCRFGTSRNAFKTGTKRTQCTKLEVCEEALSSARFHRGQTFYPRFGGWVAGTMHGDAEIEAKRRGYSARDCFNYFVSVFENKPYVKQTPKPINHLRSVFVNLKTGDRFQLQRNLKKLNYYSASIDGLYGQGTEGSIKKFNKLRFGNRDLSKKYNVTSLFNTILALEFQVVKTTDQCVTNPEKCSDKNICVYATTRKKGSNDKVWDPSSKFRAHVSTAKARGLDCGIKTQVAKKQTLPCVTNPEKCSDKEICIYATTRKKGSNDKVWISSSKFRGHVSTAKARGLDCGIETVVTTVNRCATNPSTCTVAELCSVATFTAGNRKFWSEINKKHVKLAKNIGMNCGVKDKTQSITKNTDGIKTSKKEKTCDNTPSSCTVVELCRKASTTRNGKKIWRTSGISKSYVKHAQDSGLTCNIQSSPKKKETYNVASGTGFFISEMGHIITNEHVIKGCSDIKVHIKRETLDSKLLAEDRSNDLALLQVKKTPTYVFKLSSKDPYLLQDIVAAGYPFGNKISSNIKVTRGVVSSTAGLGDNYSQMQIDAALQPGNSGGPLLDGNGNIVGVAVSKLDAKYALEKFGSLPENTNFGIKVSTVKSLLEAHNVNFKIGTDKQLDNESLGKIADDGTVLLSCWMTQAQIDTMREKKAMFSEIKMD